jgi:hypothetical protein
MAARFRHFEELVGKTAEGEAPACTAPFGGVGRPRRRSGVPLLGFDRTTSVEAVFRAFEDRGITPWPQVVGWSRQRAIDELEACLAAPLDPVDAVSPDPRIGINNPALFFGDSEEDESLPPEARTLQKYNTPPAVLFDLARIGVGTLRHFQEPDLAWLHLVGDDVPVDPPDEIRGRLDADAWALLGKFAYTVICCLYTGQQLIPLLFGYGGGSSEAREDVDLGRPAFQTSAYIPVAEGWAGWYHAHGRITSPRRGPTSATPSTSGQNTVSSTRMRTAAATASASACSCFPTPSPTTSRSSTPRSGTPRDQAVRAA